MYNSQTAFGNKSSDTSIENPICPYRKVQSMYCSASVMRMLIDQRRNMTHCLTEDFDCCPVFLAKVLRGN
jgi:hypothetical protein